MRRLLLPCVVACLASSGCGPALAWNCDIGAERCFDGFHQVCVLDHADTTPDGTLTDYVGRWDDRGPCK
jgi:hypothetical protein